MTPLNHAAHLAAALALASATTLWMRAWARPAPGTGLRRYTWYAVTMCTAAAVIARVLDPAVPTYPVGFGALSLLATTAFHGFIRYTRRWPAV